MITPETIIEAGKKRCSAGKVKGLSFKSTQTSEENEVHSFFISPDDVAISDEGPSLIESIVDKLRKADKKTYNIIIGSIWAVILFIIVGIYIHNIHKQHQETVRIQNEIKLMKQREEMEKSLEESRNLVESINQTILDEADTINRSGGPKTEQDRWYIKESRKIKNNQR